MNLSYPLRQLIFGDGNLFTIDLGSP